MKEEFVIIGGGIAGLCAANRLCELGAAPLLIEGGSYPSHKVCGEFISPAGTDLLSKWNIHPKLIEKMILRTPEKMLDFSFPEPAGSLSHLELDPKLLARAKQKGTRVLTETKVHDHRFADGSHFLELSNGDVIHATHLLIATGRMPNQLQQPIFKYKGFKAHFKQLPELNCLEMFSIHGAYLGVSPVEGGMFNVAALTQMNMEQTLQSFKEQHPKLKEYFNEGKILFDWMQTNVPEFGIKKTPAWPRTYFIGDAAATIPPASGNGISMAIQCGLLAADYAIQNDPMGFRREWEKRIKGPIFFAKLLHRAMLNPHHGNKLFALNNFLPLEKFIFYLTRLKHCGNNTKLLTAH